MYAHNILKSNLCVCLRLLSKRDFHKIVVICVLFRLFCLFAPTHQQTRRKKQARFKKKQKRFSFIDISFSKFICLYNIITWYIGRFFAKNAFKVNYRAFSTFKVNYRAFSTFKVNYRAFSTFKVNYCVFSTFKVNCKKKSKLSCFR